jgi:leucyl aminopeptidase
MTLSLSAGRPELGALDVPLLVIALPSGAKIDGPLTALDATLGGALARTLDRRDFRGGRDETLHISGAASGPKRVLLVGLGKPSDRTAALRRAGAIASRQGAKMGAGELAFFAGALNATEVEAAAVGLAAGAWEYTDTRTPPPAEERRAPLTAARILAADNAALQGGIASGSAIAEGHGLARTLGMMPGNLCTPEFLASTGRDIAKRHGLNVTVLGRA